MLQMDYDRKHNKPVNEKEYESVQKELKNLSDIYDRTVIKAFSEMYAYDESYDIGIHHFENMKN